MQWYTTNEYVDVETGEILTKENGERNYIIIKTVKRTEINGRNGK